MFRALLGSDLHARDGTILGKPRQPVCRRLFDALIEEAETHQCSHIILLGDVWHAKHPSPEVVLMVYEFLERAREKKLRVVILLGNHDVFRPGEENHSLLRIFNSGLAQIISTPRITPLREAQASLFFLPWYEADTYKERLAEVKQIARKERDSGQRVILLTHVGLSEGKPSLSNFQPPQRVSVTDIEPDLWDLVLMGDYHMHQRVADNAMYLGAPIPHTFGDEGNVGFWVLQCDPNGGHISPIRIGDRFPKFDRFVIDSAAGITVPYKKDNYTKIECAPELYERVRRMYPEAEVLPIRTSVQIADSDERISEDLIDDYPALIEKYLDLKKVDKKSKSRLKSIGLALLKKARES